MSQTYPNVEHVVVDGGSTDETVDILRESPWIRWVSEPDKNIVDAYRKAIGMATGDYVIQCCVSDGFLDPNWFELCVQVLDSQPDVSLVWGLPRDMTEGGVLGRISYSHFQRRPPPQKTEFLPYWLASGFILPEGNYCVRRDVLDRCFPHDTPDNPFQVDPILGFNYAFHANGYLPYFLPVVANFGRVHGGSRTEQLRPIYQPILDRYHEDVRKLRDALLTGQRQHVFRDGSSRPLRQATSQDIRRYRRYVVSHQWVLLRERVRLKFQRELRRVSAYGA